MIVNERGRVGDWEGDLIVGRSSRSAIGTLVDRASRYVKLIHLPDGHNAGQLHAALGMVLEELPQVVRWTLTWDQGSEMADHHRFADRFRDGVFFAHPASPWQRPTNENITGCYASTSPKAPTLRSTTRLRCARSRTGSTTDHARSSSGARRLRSSLALCHHKIVTVATITRIRPRTHVPRRGQSSRAVDMTRAFDLWESSLDGRQMASEGL